MGSGGTYCTQPPPPQPSSFCRCLQSPDVALPMLYMPDCLEATWQLMAAPREALSETTYNVTAMTFTPEQLAAAIRCVLPHFQMCYTPDFRDAIARTWPESIDDSNARRDWGWQHKYDLQVGVGRGVGRLQCTRGLHRQQPTGCQPQVQQHMCGCIVPAGPTECCGSGVSQYGSKHACWHGQHAGRKSHASKGGCLPSWAVPGRGRRYA